MDGEGETFLEVSWVGPAPSVPIAQYRDIRTCPTRVREVQGSAGTSPLCCPKWDTQQAHPHLSRERESRGLSHGPEEHCWGLGARSGIF